MKGNIIIRATILVLMLLQASTYAASGLLFGVTATGTPANASITLCLNANGPLSCQVYSVTATNLSILTTLSHSYPHAGIKSNTPGYTISGCTSAANGYCQFAANNVTPATVTLVSGGGGVPRFAYIGAITEPTFTQCTIDPTTWELSNCANSSQFSAAAGIAINAAGTRGYVATASNIQLCNINANTGAFENCSNALSVAQVLGVTLNAAGTFIYLGTGNGLVEQCVVNQQTGALSSCTSTGGGLGTSSGIAFNSTGTFAYVGNFTGNIANVCSVDTNSGNFSNCMSTGSFAFNNPIGIALNPNANIAYVASIGNDSFNKCIVDPSTGVFTSCALTGSNFSDPTNVQLNKAGTFAYVTNNNNTVTLCSVDATTGEFTNCAFTGSGFAHGAYGVAILYSNNNG